MIRGRSCPLARQGEEGRNSNLKPLINFKLSDPFWYHAPVHRILYGEYIMTGGGGPHLSSMLGQYSIFFQQAPVRLWDESLRSVTKAIFLLHCFLLPVGACRARALIASYIYTYTRTRTIAYFIVLCSRGRRLQNFNTWFSPTIRIRILDCRFCTNEEQI
jgi:hypothetical protein